MTDIKELVRENIRNLVPYSTARHEYSGDDAIYMDANESPYNRPFNRYPDPGSMAVKEKLSPMLDVPTDSIFLGNGSDEAIDLLFRVFCKPGADHAILMDPSYGMYKVCADLNDVEVDFVELDADFRLNAQRNLDRVKSHTKLIFLCSPNNPTSNKLEKDEILVLLEQFSGIVAVDEAYVDFTGDKGLIGLLKDHPNLVILRTLSKAWAGAGIRLGIALGDPYLIGMMNRVKYPYNVNLLTQEKALEILNREDQKNDWVASTLAEREKMKKELSSLDSIQEVYPSDANFLLVKVEDPDGMYDYLVRSGVIVRNRSRMTHCKGCLRITIGTPIENLRLVELLKTY